MLCGSHTFAWRNKHDVVRSFEKAIKAAAVHPQWQQNGLDSINMDTFLQLLQMQLGSSPDSDAYRQTRRLPDLLDMSYDMRNWKSTDPRDKFNALMGLASKSHGVIMEVDYTKSVEEVYHELEQLMLSKQVRQSAEPSAELEDDTTEEAETQAGSTSVCSSVDDVEGRQSQRPRSAGPHLEEDQRQILLNHVERTLERTRQLMSAGNLGRAAALMARTAQDIRQCADTKEQASDIGHTS